MYYYFDRIEINTLCEVPELKKALRSLLDDGRLLILHASDKAKLVGFKSKIVLSAPTETTLQALKNLEPALIEYSVTAIELAQDTPCATLHEANILADMICRTLVKRYTKDVFLYTGDFSYNFEKGLMGDKTLNLGKKFLCRTYARLSKQTGEPVLHQEWKLYPARIIKEKTGIKTLTDLINFDIESFVLEQAKRQLFHAEIDMDKIGKWRLGWSNRRRFSQREQMKIDLAALAFCKSINVRGVGDINFAQLDSWFKQEKTRIRAKKGRPSAWEKKILDTEQRRFRRVLSAPSL